MRLINLLEAPSTVKLPAGFKMPKGFKLKWKMTPRPTGRYASFHKRGSWRLFLTTPATPDNDKEGNLVMFLGEIDPDDPFHKYPADMDKTKLWQVYLRPEGSSGPTKTFKARFATEEEAKTFADKILETKPEYLQAWIGQATKKTSTVPKREADPT